MPLPLIAGSVAVRAATVVGTALVQAATQVALDAVIDYGMGVANGDGTPATTNPVNEITNNVVVNNVLPPQQANARHEFTLNDEVGGTERGRFIIVPRTALTTQHETATAEALNQTQTTPEGRSGLRLVPSAIRNSHPTSNNDSRVQQAPLSNQRAVAHQGRAVGRPPIGEAVALALRGTTKADGSRTSLEYHEWKFCIVDPGKHWIMLHDVMFTEGGFGTNYDGSDPISPNDAPPYYIWIKHPVLRECINFAKRAARLRRRCGGQALWESQGHATREAAVADDLGGNAEFIAARVILHATDDFSLRV